MSERTVWTCELPRPRPNVWQRSTPWWFWIIALFMMVTGVGLIAAAAAHADPIQDMAFLTTLDELGVTYPSEAQAVAIGHGVCDSLTAGVSPHRVVMSVMQGGNYDPNDAATILGAAIGSYCDDYVSTASVPISGHVGGVLR